MYSLLQGDCLDVLKTLPDKSVQCCITSPPYYGLRDYGTAEWEGGSPDCDHKGKPMATHAGFNERYFGKSSMVNKQGEVLEFYKETCGKCGAVRKDKQIGLEPMPDEYVAKLVEIFQEIKRVLKDDGTLWLNLGDSYNGSGGAGGDYNNGGLKEGQPRYPGRNINELKPKDLIGIPWRVAFALRADGWYLRSDIIWCLSGGTHIYVKTQMGERIMMVRDLVRVAPETIQLWNGQKWTQLLGINKSKRKGDELEIVLRSGERISCTPDHKFPTNRGLLQVKDLRIGDSLVRVNLPDAENPKDCIIDVDAAWFAGLYLAEGSRSDDCIQIAGHSKETDRWERVKRIAEKYGGSATRTIDGNKMSIRVYGRILIALVEEFVSGKTAHDKGIAPIAWKYNNSFIESMLDGYLSGDGHWDGQRWRLGFTRNYRLERDLRAVCARLNYHLVINKSVSSCYGKSYPSFRGELRKTRSGHLNEKNTAEIMEIKKARCRNVYDIGIEDNSHLFSLASGILTHNSKPNPMPESVKDRPTKSHEYIFLLTKNARYYYDAEAIKELSKKPKDNRGERGNRKRFPTEKIAGIRGPGIYPMANKRDVWTVPTKPFKEAHFATFPEDLIRPCVLAGCSEGETILDPFNGAGTTGVVAIKNGRDYIGIELNPEYIEMSKRRIDKALSIDKPY